MSIVVSIRSIYIAAPPKIQQIKAKDPKALDLSDPSRVIIRGRADWAVGYALSKKILSSNLVIIQVQRDGRSSAGIAQSMCYLTGAQDAWTAEDTTNRPVFGILTDSIEFQFKLLNANWQLFLFDPRCWRSNASINCILHKAIKSSPQTPLSSYRNRELSSYTRHHARFKFRQSSSPSEVKPQARQIMARWPIRWTGMLWSVPQSTLRMRVTWKSLKAGALLHLGSLHAARTAFIAARTLLPHRLIPHNVLYPILIWYMFGSIGVGAMIETAVGAEIPWFGTS
jgi:hypothetical protein